MTDSSDDVEIGKGSLVSCGRSVAAVLVVMQHNLLYLNPDRWYDTVIPAYFSFWCD